MSLAARGSATIPTELKKNKKRRRDENEYEMGLTNFGFPSNRVGEVRFSGYELYKNLCPGVAYYKRSKQFHADTHNTCSACKPMKGNG
jgi:hypothetical protein